jgi:SAM-dependent methyltransferase
MHFEDWPSEERARREYALHRNDVDDAAYRRFLSRLADPLCAHLPAGASGLDFGCGPGPALAEILRARGHTTALFDPLFYPDPAPLQRRHAFVSCSEVVEHFVSPRSEFERLRDLLAPGGVLALMTQWRRDEAEFSSWRYVHDPTHVCFYRERTLRWIAAWLGLELPYCADNVALLRVPAVHALGWKGFRKGEEGLGCPLAQRNPPP